MIEIVVAIILQITTILGGGDSDKEKAEQKEKEAKAKTEQSAAEGGAGNWND
ncbi:hypothetical protein H8S95_12750 [Pontibacter sp. KCTC 32443]|uniref:hypothetical protein n=1 Tax=Pontibacter TaxID=323449 RepID=UPI00164D72DC|nr:MULTISPECIES: hypothetical protein [Pontibacter]MBC5774938.1 hypothetical protein [Pontibacter sp. KCTC 32443]